MSLGRDDVLRSVRRYLMPMLQVGGNRWVAMFERAQISDHQRPAVLIEAGEVTSSGVRAVIPQPRYTQTMPITVALYPSLQQGDVGPPLGGRVARQLADGVERIFNVGADDDAIVFADGRSACGPLRVPLWDYRDVPLVGDPVDRKGPALASSVAWVESISVQAIQDPDEDRRWTVIADLTLSWEVDGRAAPVAPLVETIPGSFEPPTD